MFERCGLWLFQLTCGHRKSSKPGITRKTKKKTNSFLLCLFTLWPDGPLQNHTLLLFHCRKCFLHVVDCWEELNTLRILSPWVFDLCHCFLHDFLRPDWLFATARMRLVHVSAFQEMAEAPYRVSRFNLFAYLSLIKKQSALQGIESCTGSACLSKPFTFFKG